MKHLFFCQKMFLACEEILVGKKVKHKGGMNQTSEEEHDGGKRVDVINNCKEIRKMYKDQCQSQYCMQSGWIQQRLDLNMNIYTSGY